MGSERAKVPKKIARAGRKISKNRQRAVVRTIGGRVSEGFRTTGDAFLVRWRSRPSQEVSRSRQILEAVAEPRPTWLILWVKAGRLETRVFSDKLSPLFSGGFGCRGPSDSETSRQRAFS